MLNAILDHCCNAWNKLEAQPLDHHVSRHARLGPSVLISENWYKARIAMGIMQISPYLQGRTLRVLEPVLMPRGA
jgi:hypothetical protein